MYFLITYPIYFDSNTLNPKLHGLEHHSHKEVTEDFWEILSDLNLGGHVHHPCINQIMVYDG